MNIENFIYAKQKALPDDICDELIADGQRRASLCDRSESQDSDGFGKFGDEERFNGKLDREDFQVYMPQQSQLKMREVIDCAFDGLNEYKHVIASAKTLDLISEVVKLQLTPVGGGFHQWHCEQGAGTSSSRALVWMIYLNDVTDGGDTEFLYQHMKVKPEKGKLVIWPAGITHPHRGNPPYSNEKWIVTGWFEVPAYEVYRTAIKHFKHSQAQ